jgi:hypothetical protein
VKGIAIVAPQGKDHWDKMGMGSALKALRSEAGEARVEGQRPEGPEST